MVVILPLGDNEEIKFNYVQTNYIIGNKLDSNTAFTVELDELIRLNPTKQNMIHPNDILRLEPDKITKEINIRDERQRENRLSLQDITARQGYRHDNNYIIRKDMGLVFY